MQEEQRQLNELMQKLAEIAQKPSELVTDKDREIIQHVEGTLPTRLRSIVMSI